MLVERPRSSEHSIAEAPALAAATRASCTVDVRRGPVTVVRAYRGGGHRPAGLLSLGAILCMIVMAIYLFTRFHEQMNEKPGKEGWG